MWDAIFPSLMKMSLKMPSVEIVWQNGFWWMPLSSFGWPLPGSGSRSRILGGPARIICQRLEAALLLTHTSLPSSSCGAIIHSDCQSKGLAFFCLSVILMLDTGRQGKAMAKTRQRGKPLEAQDTHVHWLPPRRKRVQGASGLRI